MAVTARVVRLLLLPMMLLLPPRKMANDSGIGAQGRRGGEGPVNRKPSLTQIYSLAYI